MVSLPPATVSLNLHHEQHFSAGHRVRDVVLGMSDGLTVPFALAAGLTGAISQSRLIVTAGLAEIVAGSIAMGLGGYLAARADAEHYASELRREQKEIISIPDAEAQEVRDIFTGYGIDKESSAGVIASLRQRPADWASFMMRFELGLEAPVAGRAWRSALTIAGAYVVGGIIPLSAYLLVDDVGRALRVSAVSTACALALFGGLKGRLTGVPPVRSALQTCIIGGIAALAAFAMARWIAL
jgi:VIT1/CCC1 family predicted Fe2+/Mn2+ transporter